MHTKSLLSVAVLVAAGEARAQTADPFGPGTGASTALPAITVVAPRDLESEPTNAASEKRFSGETLNTRPLQRPGDILEATPGLAVTQHSGEGKANQYFLRGMNLDHGTDLAIWLDGMPINMRTHGHGQGYADINFLIPELVQQMTVKKGPYWAEEGDFASAGSLRLAYLDRLESNVVQGTGGSFGYWRGLAAGTVPLGSGWLTAAAESVFYNGPWDIPDNLRKFNGFLRYSEGTPANGFSVTALAYTNSWHSTDQSPRAGRRQRDPRFLRRGRSDRRRRHPALFAVDELAAKRREKRRLDRGLRHLLDAQSVQQLHLFPGQSRPRRPVPAKRQAQGAGPQRQLPAPARSSGLQVRNDGRHPDPLRRHRRRPVQHLSAHGVWRRCATTR